MEKFDVILIGAGMAGLTAARTLAERGVRVAVLEARDRIGGRILTHRSEGQTIELGAEFLHGRPPELWSLIEEAGLGTYERSGEQVCFRDGALGPCDDNDRAFHLLEGLENFQGPDTSFAEYLATLKASESERRSVLSFVEGFNAADAGQISAAALGLQQKAEDEIEGDLAFYLRGGYDQLANYLAGRIVDREGEIFLKTTAQAVEWRRNEVLVKTNGLDFTARHVIVTVPLGVLQAGRPAIEPLPEHVAQAIRQLRMGHALRFTLLFREPFWTMLEGEPGLRDLGFLLSFGETPSVWWTTNPHPSPMLTGWIGGPRYAMLANLSVEELADRACATLARIFDIERTLIRQMLVGCYTHDWSRDPFALGAYSYVAAGGLDASRRLSEPVEDTLFFAGEHTDTTGHWGTVHAAVRSGLRVARQVLAIAD